MLPEPSAFPSQAHSEWGCSLPQEQKEGVNGGAGLALLPADTLRGQSAILREKELWSAQIWGSLEKTAEKFNPGALTKSQNEELFAFVLK